MSTDNKSRNVPTAASGAETTRLMKNDEWEKVKQLITLPEAEVKRILKEPMVDASEVLARLGITQEEIAIALKSPPPGRISPKELCLTWRGK